MLLSDADRERLIERLAVHAAAGRLDVEELERRVEAVAGARTSEEAAGILADLPPVEPGSGDPGDPRVGTSGIATGTRDSRRWRRGHGEADRAALGWQPTEERFRDPRSGRVMRVWVDAAGGRHYVADETA